MAIRKMTWEKGDALGIREKGEKLDSELVLKYLQENMEQEEQLIVKCGKSFWDVTNAPEIFEQSEEFDPSQLTEIEKRQMSGEPEMRQAFQTPAKNEDPLNQLFKKTEKEEDELEKLIRKTYYYREVDIVALTLISQKTRVQLSVIAREAMERGLRMIAEEHHLGDIYAEAQEDVARHGGVRKKNSL